MSWTCFATSMKIRIRGIVMYVEEVRNKGIDIINTVKDITSGSRPIRLSSSNRAGQAPERPPPHPIQGRWLVLKRFYEALFRQAGIIRADSIDELFDYANAFTYKFESKMARRDANSPPQSCGNHHQRRWTGHYCHRHDDFLKFDFGDFSERNDRGAGEEPARGRQSPQSRGRNRDAPSDRYEKALQAVIKDDGVDGALVIRHRNR